MFPYWRLSVKFLSVKPFRPFLNGKKPYTGAACGTVGDMICLDLPGFMPLGKADTLVNVMVSFVCALQVEAFAK